jgi:ABC-type multidrug transport system fused ATPase/permease subunit
MIRAANNAVAMSLPAMAAVLSFVAYSLSGHALDPATVFSSLALFNLLRLPLMVLRMHSQFIFITQFVLTFSLNVTALSYSSIADAANAVGRLQEVFEAEVFTEERIEDPSLSCAIEVKSASFTWDSPPPEPEDKKKRKSSHGGRAAAKAKAEAEKADKPKQSDDKSSENVFKMTNINLEIPKGKLVGIVGPVGTGKTSLLQGIVGEMRKTEGTVKFSGSVAYCPQIAWIQVCSTGDFIFVIFF